MNFSIVIYNNKYYIFKIIYYSYSSASYIGRGLKTIGNGISTMGKNVYYYMYDYGSEEYLNNIDPLHYEPKLLNYNGYPNDDIIYTQPSAPPMNIFNHQEVIEYVMVEKNDLNYLLSRSEDINMQSKYNCFL